jgi:prophage antirepressor-like protein
MNELQTFSNAALGTIRSIVIDDIPYFVGKDVAGVLGYVNTRDALAKRVDAEDKLMGVAICDTNGRETKPVLINESGLYSLILTSKLPSAKEFKRWVTASVLPMIRKTGVYSAGGDLKNGDTATPMRLLSPDDYLAAARLIATCKNERLNIVLALLSKGGWEIPQISVTSRSDTSDIADRIKSTREHSGMSLQELGRASGISTEVLRAYESGRRFPKQERYTELVMLLNRIDEQAEMEVN